MRQSQQAWQKRVFLVGTNLITNTAGVADSKLTRLHTALIPCVCVCLCVCAVGMPGTIPYLSRTIPSKTGGRNIQIRAFKCKIIT